ncbi:G1/S-specific cyclin-E isoform X2 [Periplaneta americana]
MANEIAQEVDVLSDGGPLSDNIPCSETGSELDVVDHGTPSTTCPTWSQFRGMTCMLTPHTDRLSPLPVLNWANPEQVWELMCHKDEISTQERDEDMFMKHPGLQPRMRAILLDWLIEVCEVYKMHRETYHLTMDFIDRYLSRKRDIPKQQLQLIGITCLFIAAKVEEIYPPKIAEFAFVTDGACSEAEILDMELVILKALNWNLSPVTVNGWLNMFMQLCCDSRKRARQAERLGTPDPNFVFPQYSGMAFVQTAQLLDLCMLDEGSLRFPYSVLAATALYYVCNRELALFVSGLQWCDIVKCVQWMDAFASIVREEDQTLVTAAVRQGTATSDATSSSGLTKSVPDIVVDDSHNIQTHVVDLQMLDKAKMRLTELESLENPLIASPSSSSAAPGLLTPPPSSRKNMSDHKVTLAGSLT